MATSSTSVNHFYSVATSFYDIMQTRREGGELADLDLCDFCHPKEERSIVYENDSVYVMPSLGQFTEGYLLLISKEHKECVAEISDSSLLRVKEAIGDVLERLYGSACFFEHGRVGNCYQKAQNRICFHAHLHCLPVPSLIDLVEQDFKSYQIDSVSELSKYREKHPHYLYVDEGAEKRFFAVDDDIERQYLRKKACNSLGLPQEWSDWSAYPFKKRMQVTADKIEPTLSEHI